MTVLPLSDSLGAGWGRGVLSALVAKWPLQVPLGGGWGGNWTQGRWGPSPVQVLFTFLACELGQG